MKIYNTVYSNICRGMANYVKENNLSCMILGISGGLDSTISAMICKEVSKETGVKLIGVSMMCDTNKDDEISIADRVGSLFCDEYYHVNLQQIYESISNFLYITKAVGNNKTKIAEGNIKARLRMMYLWHLGGLKNGVVIDTDNLTEHYLGFWTLMGDSNYITPIGNLWKSEVYDLVKFKINEYKNILKIDEDMFNYNINICYEYKTLTSSEKEHYESIIKVLEDVINIIPTDGNGVSSSDLEQIGGKSYKEVDDILKTVVMNSFNTNEYIRLVKQYGSETVEKVITRYKNSEFKRKHLPLSIDYNTGQVVEKRIV